MVFRTVLNAKHRSSTVTATGLLIRIALLSCDVRFDVVVIEKERRGYFRLNGMWIDAQRDGSVAHGRQIKNSWKTT